MDPGRILVRVVFSYVLLLAFVRLSGKRTIRQASAFDFTVALVVGDLIDDFLWAEVSASLFVVAAGALVAVHTAFDVIRYRASALAETR